jgi:hypothetical protein
VYVSQGIREIRKRRMIKRKKYLAPFKCMINSYVILVGKHEAKR